jgi:hypothetical protein
MPEVGRWRDYYSRVKRAVESGSLQLFFALQIRVWLDDDSFSSL